jgi:dTDP-4-dehydrorhamnose reductase
MYQILIGGVIKINSKVILLGASGQLGSLIVNEFKLHQIELLTPIKKDFNLLDIKQMELMVIKHAPKLVINCSGWTNVDLAETRREEVLAVNAHGPSNLAKICSSYGIRLVHFSSDYVFSGKRSIPWAEDSPTNPINVYGESKALSEELTLQNNPSHTLIIRTSWLYGFKKGFNISIESLALGGAKNIKVAIDQTGQPTSAKELAKIVCRLALSNAIGIVHCTNSGETSRYELAKQVCVHNNLDPDLIEPVASTVINNSARRPEYSVLSNTNFLMFGFDLMLDWQTSLKNFYLEKNGN